MILLVSVHLSRNVQLDKIIYVNIYVMSVIAQLQHLVVSGDLPCSREEAAILAGIQLHLEDAWPEEDDGNQPNEREGEERENEHLLTRPDGKAGEKKRKEIFTHNRSISVMSLYRSKCGGT